MKNKISQFVSYIESIGGKHQENWLKYSYEVETIYGKMRASVHESDYNKNGSVKKNTNNNFVSIFSSFTNDIAKDYVISMSGNRFSYKLNYHLSGGNSTEENWDSNFENFKNDIDKILVKS